MKSTVTWKDGLLFDGSTEGHHVLMDAKAPVGKSSAATPKDLVAMGLGGCTGMDIIAILKKYKQTPRTFRIEVETQPTTGPHPIVFEKATLNYIVEGAIQPEKLVEAVNLSQTKYCSVSAMLSRSLPIEYRVMLNSIEIATGRANF